MEKEIECRPEDGCQGPKCPHCERREVEIAKSEEINLAVLIALVPAMTFTLFNGLGLF